MSVYSLNQALMITGITSDEKLVLIVMTARGLDTDGCYPKRAFPTLQQVTLLSETRFAVAIERLRKRGLFVDAFSEGEDSVKVVDWSVSNLTGTPPQ